MGKCKKGGVRSVPKTMRNIQNHRDLVKGAARFIALEDLIRTYSYFDMDMLSAKNTSDYIGQRINLPLVQSLALCGSPVDEEFIDDYNFHITMQMLKLGLFSNIKCLNPSSSYKPSIFNYIRNVTVDCFNDFFPDLHKEASILYVKTLAILFEYERELVESKFADVRGNIMWFGMLYDNCVYIVIKDTYCRKMFSYIKEGKITYDDIFSKFQPMTDEERAEKVKGYINDLLKPNYSRFSIGFNNSMLFEFSNDVLKSFISHQVGVCKNAFTVNNHTGYVDGESNLVKMIECKDNPSLMYFPFSYEMLLDGYNFDINAVSPYVSIARMDLSGLEDGDLGPLKDVWYADKLLDSLYYFDKWNVPKVLREYLVHLRMNSIIGCRECEISEKTLKYESSIRELKAEIKSLKRENMSVSKSLQVAEDTISEMNSRASVLLKEGEVVVQSSEIDSYKAKIADLEMRLSDTTSSLSKATGKCDWQEKQLKEYEERRESYIEIDVENHELKAENNWLRTNLERLDALNKEDEDVKQKRFEEQLSAIKDYNILFVGGAGNMLAKFKDIFPNSDYIDISEMGPNFTVPPRFQYAMVYTRLVSHSHCERLESQMGRGRILPMTITNTELVVENLYKQIVEGSCSEE